MKLVSGSYNPTELEAKVQDFWKENNLLGKIAEQNKEHPRFNFLEGPPTANGFMHIGHAHGRTLKDVMLRFKTMQGFNVWRQAGWDCQGLPVELEVEKKLNITSKKDLETRIGVENFVNECNKLVDSYLGHWRTASEKLGLSLDYDNAYETRRSEYIEFVWWCLKKAYEGGLLVEDFKVVPTCPRCGTSLSSHEVAQGYATVKDPSIYVKIKLERSPNEFIIIWTTTPWTLPGNESVTVHPDFEYVRVKVKDETWIMAKALVESFMKLLKISNYKIVDAFKGKDLEGVRYVHPLLDEVPVHANHRGKFVHSIICGEHVSLDEGTGVVHTAPAHGPEDFEVGKKYGLPVFCPIGINGHFTQEGGKYADLYFKEADLQITKDLKSKGSLLESGTVEHEYPLCWRCSNPLFYRSDMQWFLRAAPIRDKLLSENEKIRWAPEWAGTSRFQDWLQNAEDWCISRSRIWGSPLNVWICKGCGSKHVVGSISELKSMARDVPEPFEIHRPWIDKVILKCPKCGGDMNRVPYVLDCWLDSGVAHSASLRQFKDKELFKSLYPYSFITEAVDQTRGWFYSLLFTGVMLYGKAPYQSVLCQGHILDKNGQKMSKSKGNVVWALQSMETVGADSLRLYLLWKSPPWDSLSFDNDEVERVKRWLSILWNVFSFATTYMELDGFDPKVWSIDKLKDHLCPEDLWLISKTQTLIEEATEGLETFQLNQPVRVILDFIVDELSRFYIRLIRGRTWTEKEDPYKLAAYATLYESLSTLIKLLAPFAPYISEELYQHFLRSDDSKTPISVHMCEWPKPKKKWIKKKLEEDMDVVSDIISVASYARQSAKMKLRWPVKAVYISPSDEKVLDAVSNFSDLLKNQLNAKEMYVLGVGEKPKGVKIVAELNYTYVGPILKQNLTKAVNILKALDGQKVMNTLSKAGKYSIKFDDGTVAELDQNSMTFKEVVPSTLSCAESGCGKIYVDTTRTPKLLSEALAREVVRRVQVMRKEMNLNVEEFVDVFMQSTDAESASLLVDEREYLMAEIRAKKLDILKPSEKFAPVKDAYIKEWDIDGDTVKIAVVRLQNKSET